MAKLNVSELAKIMQQGRIDLSLSRADVASGTGISYERIQAIEFGNVVRPSYELVVTLADYYNWNIKELTDIVFKEE
jgi:transcriptional regulator with XRE-family HTH domain